MDDAKKPAAKQPGEKKPGEKKPGKFHYNPVGMSGKEAVLQENDEAAAEHTDERDDAARRKTAADGSKADK